MARPVRPRDVVRGKELAEWRARYPEAYGFELEWDEEAGVPVPVRRREDVVRCNHRLSDGTLCQRYAGTRTAHEGVGACFSHDSRVERAAGAWMVAHVIARVLEITPWDALLLAVKRCAAWADFYAMKMGEAEDDEQLRPGGSHYEWVEAAERVNEKLARWSKMAVDAGVQQILVQQAQTEGTRIVSLLNTAISAAGLNEVEEDRLRVALRQALLSEARGPLGVGGTEETGE